MRFDAGSGGIGSPGATRLRRAYIQLHMERLRRHWPEYAMEALELAVFMVAAAAFASLLQHPGSPVRHAIDDPVIRRALMGVAMGTTAVLLIYSPMGARSGAHINPATTLAFLRLGRVHAADAAGYVVAQFAGGLAGIGLAAIVLAPWIAAPDVNYVATLPGVWGSASAFAAEVLMTFLLMTMVLHVTSHPRLAKYTGVAVGLTVAIYITIEDPISGMSLNPARSLGPALLAGRADTLWIYFLAPPVGMLLAAELFVRTMGRHRVRCAKLHHGTSARCIFDCHVGAGDSREPAGALTESRPVVATNPLR
jgi:aquaporin Z